MRQSMDAVRRLLSSLDVTRDEREELYRHFHQHPELSMQEDKTCETIANTLVKWGIEVQRLGRTGLVATIVNGSGPIVAVRADIDALPVKEVSGKPYQARARAINESTGEEVDVAHACGHDVHITSLLGALQALHTHRDAWVGTFVGVFQPGEETASGARDLVEHGIQEHMPKPTVFLAQHVLGSLPGGSVGTCIGPTLAEAASIRVTIYGKGSHGSMPELSIDPVVLAATIVTRLQTVVAREVAPTQTAVLTVGAIHAGTKSNIIPETAELLINTRAYDSNVARAMHAAIERITRAECAAARAPRPPEFEYYDCYPLTSNDTEATGRVRAAFDAYFGDRSTDLAPVAASEDFSIIPDAFGVPYVYWGIGGFADQAAAPGNHNPAFAPDLQPTLDLGVEAIIVAAASWLART